MPDPAGVPRDRPPVARRVGVGLGDPRHACCARTLDESVRLLGTNHVDPLAWDPLIMKFCDFFGSGDALIPSRLAAGWRMPGLARSGVLSG